MEFGGAMEDLLFNSWYPFLFIIVFAFIFWLRGYMKGAQVVSNAKLKGKTVIVTGANSGIGAETAKELAYRGARLILACRNEEKAKETADYIKEKTRNMNIIPMKLDLCSFKSIRQFVKTFLQKEEKLDVLINNAGVIMSPPLQTEDEFDVQLQTNYLGPFLLTHLLLDALKNSSPSRIVNVTAVAYSLGKVDLDDINYEQKEYQSGDVYAQSKLALLMFNKTLSQKLEGTGVTVNAVHPGVVKTPGHKHMGYYSSSFIKFSLAPFIWMFMKTPQDGAQASIQCAVAEELETVSGKYFIEFVEKKPDNEQYDDEEFCQKLYEKSLEWTKMES